MVISGVVEEIVFRNAENGYTVVVIDHNGEPVVCVGKFPQISEGVNLELSGNFVKHNKYGQQFSVKTVKITVPSTKEGIIRYLSSGLIYGVGPVTALNIVEYFGEKTLDVIEYNPAKLALVKGISAKKAEEIGKAFNEIKNMQSSVMLMQNYDISTNLAIKIYNTYGAKTEQVLTTNPYRLVEDVDGIGFYTADRIANKMGIAEDSEFRFRAGILHVLKDVSEKSGNTYIPKENLMEELIKLLRFDSTKNLEKIEQVLTSLVMDSVIKIMQVDNCDVVILTKLYNIEKIVAQSINLFNMMNFDKQINVDQEIKFYEDFNKIKMHENQKQAVKEVVNNGVTVITGGPGTGKTTIVKCILQVFKNMGKAVKLLAPTGRAAKRLSESTNCEAITIHRALEIDFNNAQLFFYNNLNKLPADVVIVDEVSMVDVQLMYYLIRALKRGTQLILVGDKDQLPSVGAGNVLGDILASKVVPVVELTQIYRQDNNSLIITNAHLINNGKMPIIDNKSKDFFFKEVETPESMLSNVIDMQINRIPKFLNVDISKIQVLAPMKAGLCGVENLNKILQDKINPASFNKPEIITDKTIYRLNDRVMQIANNYEKTWKKGPLEEGAGVFNGDIGVITLVDMQTQELQVTFEDGRVVTYLKPDLVELVLSYAITIHKSQGSEFDCAIIPVVAGPPMLLTKNLIYTAVTRAKKMVVLVGTKVNLIRMIKNNRTTVRYTLLKQLLIETHKEFVESDEWF